MAPELFTDKYPHGASIDYWAIGILFFDLYDVMYLIELMKVKLDLRLILILCLFFLWEICFVFFEV